jgi:hypothetical protein
MASACANQKVQSKEGALFAGEAVDASSAR